MMNDAQIIVLIGFCISALFIRSWFRDFRMRKAASRVAEGLNKLLEGTGHKVELAKQADGSVGLKHKQIWSDEEIAEKEALWSDEVKDAIDKAFNLTIELRMDDDDGPLFAAENDWQELPPLSGTMAKVRLVHAANGIQMIKEDDGQPVTERRSLSQEKLEKVPDNAEECYFVNLTTPSGEIYSCIIAKPGTEVFGSMRAFWWSLAKMHVENVSEKLSRIKMTEGAYAYVFGTARTMWDVVIEESGSIDCLRDQLVPLRNMHLGVISQMRDTAENEAAELGLNIALAMVLATQSEDPKLEAAAFRQFKQFLWQAGDEPKEFYQYAA